MKYQLKRLERLISREVINPEDYYSIRVDDDSITLQGKFRSVLVATLLKKGFSFYGDSNGHMCADKHDIHIRLT